MEESEADAFVHAVARDWRTAPLSDQDKALCTYAIKLTRTPAQMSSADLDILRSQGLDDRAIHDATQVISYFNYINRIADALGVEREDFITPWGK
ncbi:MAG TPA: peroxidase [Anaerolineae bacterium]|nr:peroxidase [Anaerolineae bacterium]